MLDILLKIVDKLDTNQLAGILNKLLDLTESIIKKLDANQLETIINKVFDIFSLIIDKLDGEQIASIANKLLDLIARIIEEVNGERIDIVKYDKEPEVFIANALQPAKNLHVIITDPKKQECIVVADSDNFSLAIGKKGENARLASKLTHYKIDVKNTEQAREMGINFID